MALRLAQLESIIETCKDAKGADFEGIIEGRLEFQSRRFASTSVTELPNGWTEEAALGLFAPSKDPLTNTVREAYVSSIATLSPVIRAVKSTAPLPEPDVAVSAIHAKAESEKIDIGELIAGFRLQLIPTLQGLDLDSILNTFAPIQAPQAMHPISGGMFGRTTEKRGTITNWRWSWAELSPKKVTTTQVGGIAPSPMQWVDEDDMVMLTAQALEGNLTIADLPYSRDQLNNAGITDRIRLAIRGLSGNPHTLIQGANGKNHFVCIDPGNRNLVKAAQCPNRTVQVRRAFKGPLV